MSQISILPQRSCALKRLWLDSLMISKMIDMQKHCLFCPGLPGNDSRIVINKKTTFYTCFVISFSFFFFLFAFLLLMFFKPCESYRAKFTAGWSCWFNSNKPKYKTVTTWINCIRFFKKMLLSILFCFALNFINRPNNLRCSVVDFDFVLPLLFFNRSVWQK